MAAELKDRIYKVLIFRADGKDIEAFQSDDFKAVENMFNGIELEWVNSTAEKRPFKMPAPHMHSFAPSLISEIKVESISKEEFQAQNNPYYQQMQREGFSGVMNQNFKHNGGSY